MRAPLKRNTLGAEKGCEVVVTYSNTRRDFRAFAAHIGNDNASVFSTINTILAGVWLGIAYLITRSLWLATALHYSWNFAMVFVFGLPVSGFTTFNGVSWLQGHPGSPLWVSGGSYGPEAGMCATLALLVSTMVIWRSGFFKASPEMLAAIKHGKREPVAGIALVRREAGEPHVGGQVRVELGRPGLPGDLVARDLGRRPGALLDHRDHHLGRVEGDRRRGRDDEKIRGNVPRLIGDDTKLHGYPDLRRRTASGRASRRSRGNVAVSVAAAQPRGRPARQGVALAAGAALAPGVAAFPTAFPAATASISLARVSSMAITRAEAIARYLRSLDPLLPRDVVHGRKRGFSIPAAAWLRGEDIQGKPEAAAPPGSIVAVFDETGQILGRGKVLAGRLKNLLPKRLTG